MNKDKKDILMIFDGDIFTLEEAIYLYFTAWSNNPENFAYLKGRSITMISTNPYQVVISKWTRLILEP